MRKSIVIVLSLLVTSCAYCSAPTGAARHELDIIKTQYVKDLHDQPIYCNTHITCNAVRTAGYNASASLLTAESEQTDKAITKARADVAAFTEALSHE